MGLDTLSQILATFVLEAIITPIRNLLIVIVYNREISNANSSNPHPLSELSVIQLESSEVLLAICSQSNFFLLW